MKNSKNKSKTSTPKAAGTFRPKKKVSSTGSAPQKPAALKDSKNKSQKPIQKEKSVSKVQPLATKSKERNDKKDFIKKKIVAGPAEKSFVKNTQAPKLGGSANLSPRSSRASALGSSEISSCREMGCESVSTSSGYCRLHYIKNWKKIKRKEVILKEKKLNQYIEELVSKYPDKFIDSIRADLASETEFAKAVRDLEIEEINDDFESESSESIETIIGGGFRRDVDDDSDF